MRKTSVYQCLMLRNVELKLEAILGGVEVDSNVTFMIDLVLVSRRIVECELEAILSGPGLDGNASFMKNLEMESIKIHISAHSFPCM